VKIFIDDDVYKLLIEFSTSPELKDLTKDGEYNIDSIIIVTYDSSTEPDLDIVRETAKKISRLVIHPDFYDDSIVTFKDNDLSKMDVINA